MSIFTKKEKMDMKTGKWVTTQKGIINRKEIPAYDELKPQIKAAKAKQREIRQRKRAEQIKAFNKKRAAVAKRLSTVSFDEPKQQHKKKHKKRKHKKKTKQHEYVVVGGKAYLKGVTTPPKKRHKKSKGKHHKKTQSHAQSMNKYLNNIL